MSVCAKSGINACTYILKATSAENVQQGNCYALETVAHNLASYLLKLSHCLTTVWVKIGDGCDFSPPASSASSGVLQGPFQSNVCSMAAHPFQRNGLHLCRREIMCVGSILLTNPDPVVLNHVLKLMPMGYHVSSLNRGIDLKYVDK